MGGVIAVGGNWYSEKNSKKENVDASDEEISKGESVHSKKISGAKTELQLVNTSSQSEVMSVMHEMTHQKIKASKKWGATPMIKENIDTIYNLIEENDFEAKVVLLQIMSRWKTGDFSRVDKDHNTIWQLQGGTVGEAVGIMSEEEERWFVKKNFKENVLNVWLEENK